MYCMDPRLLDVLSAIGSFIVFLLLLIGLPSLMKYLQMPGLIGMAYIMAIAAFILVISGAGYMVNEKMT
jgi:hypothetical protein